MNRTAVVVAGIVAMSLAGTASAQQVSLTLKDGRVTLQAQNATIRQVLAEWERLGHVRIVGVDRLAASQPLTLTLNDVSERQALDIVLRGVPGYMVIDRMEPMAGASRYDRLVLLARTSTPTPTPAAAAGPAPAQPPFAQTIDQVSVQAPDRGDVEQFEDANSEPPMPTAPVVSPYPGGAAPAVMNSGGPAVSVQPPETQFDYANPQRYLDRMRQMQQQTGGQAPVSPYAGSTLDTAAPPAPTATPTAPGTLAKPGIAPTQTTPPQQQQFFNPYNLPPEQLQGNPTGTATPSATPVEPDRAKYANPYVPTPNQKPPE